MSEFQKGGFLDGASSEPEWITVENGQHVPIEKGESKAEAIAGHFEDSSSEKIKMTPAEKIASVHIAFDRDNILPELNEQDLAKIGVDCNKSVLLKKSVIERNAVEHGDLTDSDFASIIANALYKPSEVFLANKTKPYYHFAKVIEINSKGKPEIGLALLDVDDKKHHFEVVHAHFIEVNRLDRMREKAKKKD